MVCGWVHLWMDGQRVGGSKGEGQVGLLDG